jgi:hypothetical protein
MRENCKAWIRKRRGQVLAMTMFYRRLALSAAVCLVATTLLGEEPECETNYRSDGKSAETFVLTGLTPKAVIEQLPAKLIAAGASMQWADIEKGTLKAEGLDVKAETSGSATRVTFRVATGVNKATLCHYASLVGNPPLPPAPAVVQDPALIAQMKDDLIRKNRITQRDIGLNTATFTSRSDFLELTIKSMNQLAAGKRAYDLSMLLPRSSCTIANEDVADGSSGFGGKSTLPRTKPVRLEASLIYEKDGEAWRLTEATISHIESTK